VSTPRYFQGKSVTGPVFASDAKTFKDFVDYLRICPTLGISHADFLKLDKKTRNTVKQVPFFVPASFKTSPSERLMVNAEVCNLICLDIDDADDARPYYNDPDRLFAALGNLNFAAYTTVSSTPQAPRMRIVVGAEAIPVARYADAVRTIGAMLGLSVTRESKVAVQPMFLPTMFNDSSKRA
jgi:hypothetical protein